jgi:hypothetical protein
MTRGNLVIFAGAKRVAGLAAAGSLKTLLLLRSTPGVANPNGYPLLLYFIRTF